MKRGVSHMISVKPYFSEMELMEDQNISCQNINMGYQQWMYLLMPSNGKKICEGNRWIEGGIVGEKPDS